MSAKKAPKPRGSIGEIIGLIHLKRERARESMLKMMEGRDDSQKESPAEWNQPDSILLLDYISNMAPCLELMAKLLSGNWDSHKIGEMYRKTFGKDLLPKDFREHLETALRDQKYFFKPVTSPANPVVMTFEQEIKDALASGMKPDSSPNLAHFIPEMEQLFDEFKEEMTKEIQKGTDFEVGSVVLNLELPITFGEYLRDNVSRFFVLTFTFDKDTIPKPEVELKQHNERMNAEWARRVADIKSKIATYLESGTSVLITQGRHFHHKYLK